MNILHLEDEVPLQEIVRIAFLSAYPRINFQQFGNSDPAWQYILEHQDETDLYILDVRVPGKMNGFRFAEKLREHNATGTIIINSAYGKPEIEWLKQYQAHWFEKPKYIIDAPRHFMPLARQNPDQVNEDLAKYCHNCNQKLAPTDILCSNCGVSVNDNIQLDFRFRGNLITIPIEEEQKLVVGRSTARIRGTADLQKIETLNSNHPEHFLDLAPYAAIQFGVSRRHVLIHQSGGELTVEDMGSRNGTYLNGKQLKSHDKHVISDGDSLLLGRFAIEVYIQKNPES